MSEAIRREAEELFEELGLADDALLSAWSAYELNPKGTILAARDSFKGHSPAGLFLHKLQRGEHLKTPRDGKRRTGFRMARGTHGISYIPDPKGIDPVPMDHEQ